MYMLNPATPGSFEFFTELCSLDCDYFHEGNSCWVIKAAHFKTGYKIINSWKLSAFKFCGILYEFNEWLNILPILNSYP